MKKTIFFIVLIICVPIIMVVRKYPENHVSSFLTGISCALPAVFYIYIISVKKFKNN